MTLKDYRWFKAKIQENDDHLNIVAAVRLFFRLCYRYEASHTIAQQGLILYYKFIAKHYCEDWDFRVVAASAFYLAMKKKTQLKGKSVSVVKRYLLNLNITMNSFE